MTNITDTLKVADTHLENVEQLLSGIDDATEANILSACDRLVAKHKTLEHQLRARKGLLLSSLIKTHLKICRFPGDFDAVFEVPNSKPIRRLYIRLNAKYEGGSEVNEITTYRFASDDAFWWLCETLLEKIRERLTERQHLIEIDKIATTSRKLVELAHSLTAPQVA